MRRRDKFCLLTWQQRRVLVYAYLLLNTTRLALSMCPFGFIRRQQQHIMSVWVLGNKTNYISVNFIVWAVSVSSRYAPGGAKCLAKALTTQLLMNRYGYEHSFRIGVARDDTQKLEAHAWVEYRGQVVIGDLQDLNRFKLLSASGASK